GARRVENVRRRPAARIEEPLPLADPRRGFFRILHFYVGASCRFQGGRPLFACTPHRPRFLDLQPTQRHPPLFPVPNFLRSAALTFAPSCPIRPFREQRPPPLHRSTRRRSPSVAVPSCRARPSCAPCDPQEYGQRRWAAHPSL